MIEKSIIIALMVLSIWYTMKEGEIFSALGKWLDRVVPEKIKPAVHDCPVCMTFWHGSYLYFIFYYLWLGSASWQEWPIVVIAAMGMNAALNKLAPEKPKGRRVK